MSPSNPTRIAAIFDLDDTLLSESTGRSIFRYLRDTDIPGYRLHKRDLMLVLGSTLLYHYGFLDATRAMQATARLVRGLRVDAVWEVVERWFTEMVEQTISPGALDQLAWHRAQGHVPVICTASSQFSVVPVARRLGIEHIVYTAWLDDGVQMTGDIQLPLAYGAGKVFWMRRWAEANGVSLRESYFYSDHQSDVPLMELVAHPGAVNPNAALARIAAARDWPVLRWH